MSDRIESKQAIRTGTRVTGVREKEDHVAVTVDNGPSVTADLVIGANGVRSCVRDAIELAQPNGRIQSDKCKSIVMMVVFFFFFPLFFLALF